jgi:type II secretory pathway pseudopilin PulG
VRLHARAARAVAARKRSAGFSIVEILISATVFMLVSGAVVTTLVASSALNHTNRETVLAAQAAESMIEELKSTPFAEVFARYNDTKDDDPGTGASPGIAFAVAGLAAQADDADGIVGTIAFPGDGVVLREDADDAELGLPRDLDRDGAVDDQDKAASYRILPVRVRLEWRGANGNRALELVTVLTQP